jgi:hypothetical protein
MQESTSKDPAARQILYKEEGIQPMALAIVLTQPDRNFLQVGL